MTLEEIKTYLKAVPFMLEEEYNDLNIFESIEAAVIAIDALETIREAVAEIEAAAKMRDDFEVSFTAGMILGTINREIVKVEGKT